MEIPLELRRLPPTTTLEWIAGRFGRRSKVTAVRRMHNAWAAAVHAVDVEDAAGDRHELVVRRWARTDTTPAAGAVAVENEAATLTLLASASSPRAPTLVAADPSAASADVPTLVMTRLPGRDVLAPTNLDAHLDGLVTALRAIHSVPVAGDRLGRYAPWGLDDLSDPPAWSRRPEVWRRAFAIAHRPVPRYVPVLCHRDFHPGNVLWHFGEVSGVVDWTSTCIGPAAADVAHCRANLALLFGPDVADEFARRYGPVDDLAWFDVVDVAGWRTLDTWRWHDAGRSDITDETIIRAFDGFLAGAVERAS